MGVLILLAAKSLILAGGTLLLLRLMRSRSASDRSWIAHLGLGALALLPIVSFALPALEVAGPAWLTGETGQAASTSGISVPDVPASASSPSLAEGSETGAAGFLAGIDWALWGYALPTLVLCLITLVALGRLGVLKARAKVLVDPHWLTALAHAQHRMNFKNGTALLTSDDLRSPISWGLVRPVILLSKDAANAHREAEAIIAHELAHVARFDWAKLMVARLTVALFWFNPLVWLLAREAHQLREEAADDAVLAADIEDTDYANLLVGIARHECRGLLIGAHGVAPGRKSLARRVKRVLDAASKRAPGGWRWTSAAAFFAAGMSVPVAALQFVDPAVASASKPEMLTAQPRDTAAGASSVAQAESATESQALAARNSAETTDDDFDIDPPNVRIPAIGVPGRVPNIQRGGSLDDVIAGKIHGVTPRFGAQIRASSPRLRNVGMEHLVAFRIHGVTPEYVRAMSALGYNLGPDELTAGRIHGVSTDYVRSMNSATSSRISFDRLLAMRIHGIDRTDLNGGPDDP